MNIIIPMAGLGKRLRPHTLTTPKPLIPVFGKPIVYHLVEELIKVTNTKIQTIGFIVGRFGVEVEKELISIANQFGARGKIFYQDEALGTAHAVNCASELLHGPVIVAFADTLFKADFIIDDQTECKIWVKKVNNPESFGVVTLSNKGLINGFMEKPSSFVSNLAIIGIYYFRDAELLLKEIAKIIQSNFKVNNEFQLTDALQNMLENGIQFQTGEVEHWLDCGNELATIDTNKQLLVLNRTNILEENIQILNSVIIEPCFIGKNTIIENSVVGPFVSVGRNNKIKSSVIENSLIQNGNLIENANLNTCMIGSNSKFCYKPLLLSIGDFNKFE